MASSRPSPNQSVSATGRADAFEFAVKVWIIYSAGAAVLGWVLSALHCLTWMGYRASVSLLLVTFVILGWRYRDRLPRPSFRFRPFRIRLLPFLWAILILLVLLGGALYSPLNLEGTSYRIPRTLHWLWQGHWHWIHSFDGRMNNRGFGMEWLSLPIMTLTRSERGLFLLNVAAYALLPGLTFRVFREFTVPRWLSWFWMWVLPAGCCYAIQAGGIANDAYSTSYALAAVWFSRQFSRTGRTTPLCFSLLSAALLTGNKVTNLPLLLPWLVALFPLPPRYSLRPLPIFAACVAGFLASALPSSLANVYYLHDWTGLSHGEFKASNPIVGFAGNVFLLVTQNLMPPLFFWADKWNAGMQEALLHGWARPFRGFESFGWLPRSVREETAALGPGIILVIVVALFASRRKSTTARFERSWATTLLLISPWISLFALMINSGLREIGRVSASYGPMAIASLFALYGAPSRTARRLLVWVGTLAMLLTIFTLVISRHRPLFPSAAVLAFLNQRFPKSQLVASATTSFATNETLRQYLRPFAEAIPADVTRIGLVGLPGPSEYAISLPLGRFDIQQFVAGDDPVTLREKGIRYVVVEEQAFVSFGQTEIRGMLKILGARQLRELSCQMEPTGPPRYFYLVYLDPAAPPRLASAL